MRQESLLGLIDVAAKSHSRSIAISCATVGEVTYSQFLKSSRQVRQMLCLRDVAEGRRVVIYMKRSAAIVISMHAVLSAGCSYVPIYHGTPADRVKQILDDCKPAAVICDQGTSPRVETALTGWDTAVRVVEIDAQSLIDTDAAQGDIVDIGWLRPELDFSILYTSGSTGTPKGVMLTHGNLMHYIEWAIDYFGIQPSDVILSTAPFHFDMSSFDVFASLAVGARLVIASEKECLFPTVLLKRLSTERVTVWKGVSSLLSNIALSVDLTRISVPHLRALIFSGERMPVQDLEVWLDALPSVEYFNGYGPTEATGVSCCYKVPLTRTRGDVVPIGAGRFDGEVLIFDDDQQITKPGRTGQIVITGPGVAKGYWQDSSKTRKSFVTEIGGHRFERSAYLTGDMGYFDEKGHLVFVSRSDRQIKHQGYRIELDDIEAALHRMPEVSEAAVIYKAEGSLRGPAAFYQAVGGADEVAVRKFLATQLPAYMVPKFVKRLSVLPRNDRGKIDYSELERGHQ